MKKKDIPKYIIPAALTALITYFLFAQPQICTDGVKKGITLCAEIVIPSLFPFMVVASFILKSGLGDAFGRLFDRLTRALFRLPGVCTPVILMSLVGGFPVGAKMTADLLHAKNITENQARRLYLFCINGGPAFVISTVGSILLGSTKAGILIYIATVLASLLTGVLTIALHEEEDLPAAKNAPIILRDPVSAFVDATTSAAVTMLSVSAWVIVFRTVCDITGALNLHAGTKLFLDCLLEVTNGCQSAAGALPIPALAAIISFGGLSVHCQIFSYVRESGLKMRYFYTARVVSASFAAIICMGLLKLFPVELSVFATNTDITAAAYSVSVPACAVLLIMSALLIFEVDTGKKI